MKKKRFEVGDDESWIMASVILLILTLIFQFSSLFERTFFLCVFIVPTIISIGFSIYLKFRGSQIK
ncbi:MAG: hypothetical protein J7L83_03750 [Thaumarchaeota archaeon]|nr:hypothetical protein [Nitrososphaerota archaeon]